MSTFFAVTTVILAVFFVYAYVRWSHAESRIHTFKSMYEAALEAGHQLKRERDSWQRHADHITHIYRPDPFTFAEQNRDLMPPWLTANPNIAAMDEERQFEHWATWCANLTIISREHLEDVLNAL